MAAVGLLRNRRSLILALIVIAATAASAVAWRHRAGVKYRLAVIGLRVAHPFVRDLTAPMRAQMTQQDAEIAQLREQTAKVADQVQQTLKEIQQQGRVQKRREPEVTSEGQPQRLIPVMGPLGEIGLYSGEGRVEIYGAALQEVHASAIAIKDNILRVTHQNAVLAWWPRFTASKGAAFLRLKLAKGAGFGKIKILVKFNDGYVHSFVASIGAKALAPEPPPIELNIPKDLSELLAESAPETSVLQQSSGEWLFKLPEAVLERLERLGPTAISQWIVQIKDAANTLEHIQELGFVKRAESEQPTVNVAGQIIGPPQPPGAKVLLTTETGAVAETLLSPSNTYTFRDLPKGQPISIRFRLNEQDFFASQGRWMIPEGDRTDVDIVLEPFYFNQDGHPADPSKAMLNGQLHPTGAPTFHEAHARSYWTGFSKPQVYDSYTFANNWGYFDRDRFFDNPDHCLRIVHLGSSHAEAIQVPIGVKYNSLMEEELGVRLGRCVEVISAGRDNGDPGSNYLRIKDYAVRFNPDIVLLELNTTLTMQLHPKLLKSGFGWDHEHNALDNFEYGTDGKLTFRTWDKNYAIHTVKPDYISPVPGVRLFDVLKLPWDKLPSEGREAFRYLGDIINYFRAHHPKVRFIIHDGLDQAQCLTACADQEVTLQDGTKVKMGVETFRRNFLKTCKDYKIECLDLPFPPEPGNPEYRMIWYQDGHYNVRGHQWLARQLSKLLSEHIVSAGVRSETTSN